MVELYEYTWINKNFQKKTRCPRLYYLSRFMMRLNYKRLGYMRLNYLRLDYLRLNYLRLNHENVKVFLTNTSFSNVQSPALEDAICGEARIRKYYVTDAHLFLEKITLLILIKPTELNWLFDLMSEMYFTDYTKKKPT